MANDIAMRPATYSLDTENRLINNKKITPGGVPESQFFMPHLLDQGIDVLAFGGTENFGFQTLAKYWNHIVRIFMFDPFDFNRHTDMERAEVFRREFARRVRNNDVPAFSWIFFGDNHARGLRVGEPIPEYWVGENDQAVGMVVEAVSNSPIWEESLIFITEDDAQSGFDHVDKHRCPALAIGPYVKRGYVSNVMYTINNFHKTTELLLGSKPMHRLDERAVGMYDIFTAKADTTVYDPVIRDVPRTPYEGPENELTRMSASMDWSPPSIKTRTQTSCSTGATVEEPRLLLRTCTIATATPRMRQSAPNTCRVHEPRWATHEISALIRNLSRAL